MPKTPPIAEKTGAPRADALRNRARILDAAVAIFAEQGASASTEAVAARAGLAIGTVFRHFPTKPDLLSAVVMNAWERLVAEVEAFVGDATDAGALRAFCASVMATSAANRAVLAKLAETGTRVHVGDALSQLRPHVQSLLSRAQKASLVRDDLSADELIALLGALCQEAITEDWPETLRHRALTMLFEGLGAAPGAAAAVLLPEEFDRLAAQARFVAAVQMGLDDQEAGRTISDEELGKRLDARFGALRENKK